MGFKIENGVLKEYIEEEGVTEAIIPYGVTEIDGFHSRLQNHSYLKSVVIPESVTKINDFVFFHKDIENFVIPKSVTYIERNVFCNTKWYLEMIKENPLFIINNILISGENCKGDVIIPNGVTKIVSIAFGCCKEIKSIFIPNTVKYICKQAFAYCEKLETVVLPKGLEIIKELVFERCISLKNIDIPNTITCIGEEAFKNCTQLESIVIPDSVVKISVMAFYDCINLKNIVFPKNNLVIEAGAFGNTSWIREKIKKNPLVIVNDTVIEVGNCKYEIVIPESIKEIADEAFSNRENLKDIIIPESVEKIGKYAFYNTDWLWNKFEENPLVIVNNILVAVDRFEYELYPSEIDVVIPDGVTSIVPYAFWKNDIIRTIVIPESVTYIGEYALGFERDIILKKSDVKVKIRLFEAWNQWDNKASEINLLSEFISNKTKENFKKITEKSYKILSAVLMMLSHSDSTGFYIDFLKKNKFYAMKYLIDMGDIENLLKLLPLGFVNAENVDELVMYANEKKQTEIQMKLMNYKHDYIGYNSFYDEFEV